MYSCVLMLPVPCHAVLCRADRSLKAKRIMHYAAEQAGMTLACTHNKQDGQQLQDQTIPAHEAASAVLLIHEQEAAALSACIDPMRDIPTLTVCAAHAED